MMKKIQSEIQELSSRLCQVGIKVRICIFDCNYGGMVSYNGNEVIVEDIEGIKNILSLMLESYKQGVSNVLCTN